MKHPVCHVAKHIGIDQTIGLCGAKVKTMYGGELTTVTFWTQASCQACKDIRKADEVSLALMNPNQWLSTRNDP